AGPSEGTRGVASPNALQIDLPEVLAEMEAIVSGYEAARAERDLPALNGFYRQSGRTGTAADGPLAGLLLSEPAAVSSRCLTTFGRDFASSSVMLADGSREVQAWARLQEGWRIVAAQRG